MIDPRVGILATQFVRYFNKTFAQHPKYLLDFSWPSVGLVDLFTYHIRGKENLTENDKTILSGAAAYLAGMAHDLWQTMSSPPELSLTLSDGPSKDVILEAKGGRYLKHRATFQINVTQSLAVVILKTPKPLHYYNNAKRNFDPQDNLLSAFAFGLMTGLSPFGTGPWASTEEQPFLPNIIGLLERMTESSAAFYSRLYPTESLGAASTLYRANLIYPPLGHTQDFPGIYAATGLVNYFNLLKLTLDDMREVTNHLAVSPDETISTAGFIVGAALVNREVSPALLALTELNEQLRVELRPAIVLARSALKKPHDWTVYVEKGDFQTAESVLALDQALGLLPLFRIKRASIKLPQLKPVLHHLAWSNAAKARQALDGLSSELPADVLLQGVHLDLYLGDFERAESELSDFSSAGMTGDSELIMNYLLMRGNLAQAQGEFEPARGYLEEAWQLVSTEDKLRYASVGITLARCYIALGQLDDALRVLDSVLSEHKSSIASLLLRVSVLRALEREEDAIEDISTLVRYSPNDRRVFGLLLTSLLPI